jgi:hypothetical protein
VFHRRQFLLASLGLLAARAPATAATMPHSSDTAAALDIDPDRPIGTIPSGVMGLSYESTLLGEPDALSPANADLAGLFKTLSPRGSLRLGGNTSEFTYFQADASVRSPSWSPAPTQPGELTPITPLALHNLRGFLDATGWTCIYGLNLGTGTPERAAEEARAVTQILGPTLDYLQIGNEANNYIRYRLRSASWDPSAYLAEWFTFARAIIARVPDAKIAGPDMYADRAWVTLFAQRAERELGSHLVALTDHYYAEGPPTSPQATIENLLHDTRVDDSLAVMSQLGAALRLPYRMTEVNSCYLGGKPGVSDTLGSALWAANLTLRLAATGFAGANFHGGGARQIKAALGGTLPGDAVAKTAAADAYYTPIAGTAGTYRTRPIFAGMMLAARLAGTTLVASRFRLPQTDLLAYAAVRGRTHAVVLNVGRETKTVSIGVGTPVRSATALRLTGPRVDATSGVRFGATEVGADGARSPGRGEPLQRARDERWLLTMPPTSAALVALDGPAARG